MATFSNLTFALQPNQVVPFTMVIFQGAAQFNFNVDPTLSLDTNESVNSAGVVISNTALELISVAINTPPIVTISVTNNMLNGDTSSLTVQLMTNQNRTLICPFRIASGPGM